MFHERPEVDLAVLPYPSNSQDDLRSIPETLFMEPNNIHVLEEVFFLSFQPGIPLIDRVRPVYRTGAVSLIQRDETIVIEGAAFPGNSGSPVFMRPRPVGFGAAGGAAVFPSPNAGRFLGIIGSYFPYQEVAVSLQTHKPRIVFEEHTGLSQVWSVELIREITRSLGFTVQVRRLVAAEKR